MNITDVITDEENIAINTLAGKTFRAFFDEFNTFPESEQTVLVAISAAKLLLANIYSHTLTEKQQKNEFNNLGKDLRVIADQVKMTRH